MHTVELTKQGRYALVDGAGKTVHLFDSQLAAQTACDFKNRSNYEPTGDPYQVPAGRWTKREEQAA